MKKVRTAKRQALGTGITTLLLVNCPVQNRKTKKICKDALKDLGLNFKALS